jgi:hypothetical protein
LAVKVPEMAVLIVSSMAKGPSRIGRHRIRHTFLHIIGSDDQLKRKRPLSLYGGKFLEGLGMLTTMN